MSDENAPVEKDKAAEAAKPIEEKPPVVTSHSLNLGNTTLDYTVTTGLMPLKDDKGETQAHIFYMAYVVPQTEHAAPRPLTFVFNGGPGSSSVWLHLGAVGPKRVKMEDEGWMPPPPYQLVDNPHTWLDLTDLVFIDPVGTGYSRPVKPDDGKNYWSVQGDLESVGEFIRLYLTRNSRWTSPLYVAGESYGTTRAAGLSGYLVDKGIAFNGLLLISTVANFQTLEFERGNDLPYVLFLPTYAATAWYHQKLPADLLARPLEDVLREVEAWAANEYTVALMQGNQLQGKKRTAVVKQLARYTGLEARHIEQSNLRIQIFRFCKELLRDQNRTVGRLDSRFKGMDALAVTEFPEFDPSMQAILPPYTAMLNQYVRTALRYETDVPYEILSFNVNRGWEWERGKFPDTSEALRSALAKNPYMRVFLGMGYYDLATPHFATQYTLSHLEIDPSVQPNLVWAGYPAGHMFYLDVPSLEKLKADVRGFMGV